jgi:heme/copper-type cytochrome/quinol oxidase subunit 2
VNNLLYLIKWDIIDYMYAIFIIGAIICLLFLYKFKKYNSSIHSNHFLIIFNTIAISIIVMVGMVCLMGLSQKIYCIYQYSNNNYKKVSGEVANFEYIYDNNSYNVRGVRFNISGKSFYINKGILNAGYSYRDNIISKNGQKYTIYYIDDIDTILRIDLMN